MNLYALIVGKTVMSVEYHDHEFIGIQFSDGSILRIEQRSQTGTLYVNLLEDTETEFVVHEVIPDNAGE